MKLQHAKDFRQYHKVYAPNQLKTGDQLITCLSNTSFKSSIWEGNMQETIFEHGEHDDEPLRFGAIQPNSKHKGT